MGYYSDFELSVEDYGKNGTTDRDIVNAMLDIISENKYAFYPFAYEIENETDSFNGTDMTIYSEETSKWYDNEEEMLELSRRVPDVILKLHVVGEEPGDISDTYFKNGKKASYKYMPQPLNLKDLE